MIMKPFSNLYCLAPKIVLQFSGVHKVFVLRNIKLNSTNLLTNYYEFQLACNFLHFT